MHAVSINPDLVWESSRRRFILYFLLSDFDAFLHKIFIEMDDKKWVKKNTQFPFVSKTTTKLFDWSIK